MAKRLTEQTSLIQRRNYHQYVWVLLSLLWQPALSTAARAEQPGELAAELAELAPASSWPAALGPGATGQNDQPGSASPQSPQADRPPSGLAIPQPESGDFTNSFHELEADSSLEPPLVPGTYLTTAASLTAPPVSAAPSPPQPPPEAIAQNIGDEEPLPQDPELGVIQVRGLLEDNDLGILRIREQPSIPAQVQGSAPKIGFFQARMAIANSDNILLAGNDVGGLTGDTFVRPSISFAVYPLLGPQTAFIATADLGLQRYVSQSSLNYDDLRFRVGIRQGITPRSYGQLIFGYQELFRPGPNRRQFFKNTSLALTVGRRDPLATNLILDSYYLIQFNGAQSSTETTVTDFSRLFQSAGAYLGYDITPQLQTGISYQINLIDYTSLERYDTFQQVLGQFAYRITSTVRMSIYGGFSFGQSSERLVIFNDTFFGAVVEATIPLF